MWQENKKLQKLPNYKKILKKLQNFKSSSENFSHFEFAAFECIPRNHKIFMPQKCFVLKQSKRRLTRGYMKLGETAISYKKSL